MFNLLMSGNEDAWDLTAYKADKDRFLEHTEKNIKLKFESLTLENLESLKKFPTVFAIENEAKESRIGYIENLKIRNDHILVEYKFDPILPSIPQGALKKLSDELDIGKYEMNRTHWAVKDDDIFKVLIEAGYLSKEIVDYSIELRNRKNKNKIISGLNTIDSLNNNHVFIVHGQDDLAKNEVSQFISNLGLIPIILHEQANLGKTIIEKIETYTNVGFAVVLYTPCDVGNKKSDVKTVNDLKMRARQNVVLEHGYLMAKLGRARVSALVKGKIETPNDISGVVYIDYDDSKNWAKKLQKEITEAGIEINPKDSNLSDLF